MREPFGEGNCLTQSRSRQWFAHTIQVQQVGVKSLTHGRIFKIGNVILLAGFAHQQADLRIVNVTDAGE